MNQKISERSLDDLVESAARVIRDSWITEEDAADRAEDAAYLIVRRLDYNGMIGINEIEITKQILDLVG